MQAASNATVAVDRVARADHRPLLTVVVPVYNGGDEIVENLRFIRRAAAGNLAGEEVELVVVSDGSLDDTVELLLAARSDVEMRVIHYDRNLGKGYAVKLGALAAHGDWIALVDSDLDLDPAAIPAYLDAAREQGLDLAVGSKCHPESDVSYPRSRRIASWCFQQLARVLFRLDVRDTQVGLKIFSRDVAERVVPLLLVKRFAFDLELLAVARALGYGRVAEMPVRLDYRFTGSGVRSRAVLGALVDTAAIFYRLRVLRTYQRKQAFLGGQPVLRGPRPLVSLLGTSESAATLDYEPLEVVPTDDAGAGARAARADLVAVLGPNARPASNWLTACVPYFGRPDVAAVVVPSVTPPSASLRERAAAAVLESRLGGGSRRSRFFPGNVRIVDDHRAENFVIRRRDLLALREAGVEDVELVGYLADRGRRTVYIPDTMVLAAPDPLFLPHLRSTLRHAVARGAAARRTRGRSVSLATALSLVPAAGATVGLVLIASGSSQARRAGVVLLTAYAAITAGSAILAGFRFRSLRVGVLAAPTLLITQGAHVLGFLRGLVRGPAGARDDAAKPARAETGAGGLLEPRKHT